MFRTALLLGAALCAFPAFAQSTSPDEAEVTVADRISDDLITVTAAGLTARTDQTGQAVSVLGLETIERIQGPDLSRVFARLPGVSITRNGPLGSFTGVSVRGADAAQLLVLVDGVRVADQAAPGGGFDFGTLMAGEVGKVDLTRSSNSTIWGADALGGVMQLDTRGARGLAASVEYGARNTLASSVSGGLAGAGYDLSLAGSAVRTDGFSAAASGTEPDGLNQWGVSGIGHVTLAQNLEAFATGRYAEGFVAIDGFPPPIYSLADTRETQKTRQASGAAGLGYYGMDLTLKGAFSVAETQRDNFDPASGTEPTFASVGRTDALTLRGEYKLIGGLVLAFGGEQQWSTYRTSFDREASTAIGGLYAQGGWVMGELAAHLGVRYDHHRRFGGETSFGGDVSYGLGSGWRLKASAGEGFKAPTLFQLFSDYGNPLLQPERATSFDAGIEHGSAASGVHLALTAFRRDSRDLIAFLSCFGSTATICQNRPFGTYDNVKRARAQGLELEAGYQVTQGLRVSGQYSLVDTKDRSTRRDLARRPQDTATLWADWTGPKGIALGAELRLVSTSFDDAANSVRLGGYEVLDLRASVPVSAQVELFGRVENVFDRSYQTAAGYNSAPRGAFIGVRGRM